MSKFSKKVFKMAEEEQARQQSSLCERIGHPIHPLVGQRRICPRCGKIVVNPETLLSKEIKLDIGIENKNNFNNTIQTEVIE